VDLVHSGHWTTSLFGASVATDPARLAVKHAFSWIYNKACLAASLNRRNPHILKKSGLRAVLLSASSKIKAIVLRHCFRSGELHFKKAERCFWNTEKMLSRNALCLFLSSIARAFRNGRSLGTNQNILSEPFQVVSRECTVVTSRSIITSVSTRVDHFTSWKKHHCACFRAKEWVLALSTWSV